MIYFFISNFYINLLGFEVSFIETISIIIILAAFIKSAQFGMHIWLPDSMEAPVPASALIHSATLVSAGVYLLLRFSPLFELSTYAFYIIPVIGSITAMVGGVSAAYQSDIKKILAYSTISHCGFLMVSFVTSYYEYTLLYLYVHGFFKAAVFLCVGNIIRFSKNYQDFRKMGGLYKILPFEAIASFICLINLCCLPFTLGFYIKHILLIGLPFYINMFIYINVIIGALSGIVYSFRLYYYSFFDTKKAKKGNYLYTNKLTLRSRFYSNTTMASTCSILLLIVFSYLISAYMYSYSIYKINFKSEFDQFSYFQSNLSNFYFGTKSFYKNISYVNWLILFVILCVYLIKWRYTYKYSFFLTNFYFYIHIFIYSYIIIYLIV